VLLLRESDGVGAEPSFERASTDPNHTEACIFLRALMESRGRLSEALQLKQRALKRDPRHLFARELLCGPYRKTADFYCLLAEEPKHAETLGLSGEALAAATRATKAIKHMF
jgi:hypothetical protein